MVAVPLPAQFHHVPQPRRWDRVYNPVPCCNKSLSNTQSRFWDWPLSTGHRQRIDVGETGWRQGDHQFKDRIVQAGNPGSLNKDRLKRTLRMDIRRGNESHLTRVRIRK